MSLYDKLKDAVALNSAARLLSPMDGLARLQFPAVNFITA